MGVAAVPVLLHHRRFEQTHLVIPHEGLFVDAMQGGKLPDGK